MGHVRPVHLTPSLWAYKRTRKGQGRRAACPATAIRALSARPSSLTQAKAPRDLASAGRARAAGLLQLLEFLSRPAGVVSFCAAPDTREAERPVYGLHSGRSASSYPPARIIQNYNSTGVFTQPPPIAAIQTAHALSGCAIVAEPGRTLPFVSA
jgi:hypothetical protein